MTPHQIAKWAADGESETLELKRTTGERKEAAKAVCAMLNHRGGRVLIGVEPDGRVIGQEVARWLFSCRRRCGELAVMRQRLIHG